MTDLAEVQKFVREGLVRIDATRDTIDALVAQGALGEEDLVRVVRALKALGWKDVPAASFAKSRLARGGKS